MRDQISKVIQERDQFRSELQETLKGKKQVEFRFEADRKSNKEREAANVKRITQLTKEKGDNEDEILNLQRMVKQLGAEKEKSKLRIQKLIQRKGKFDSGFKTCKKCGKEY